MIFGKSRLGISNRHRKLQGHHYKQHNFFLGYGAPVAWWFLELMVERGLRRRPKLSWGSPNQRFSWIFKNFATFLGFYLSFDILSFFFSGWFRLVLAVFSLPEVPKHPSFFLEVREKLRTFSEHIVNFGFSTSFSFGFGGFSGWCRPVMAVFSPPEPTKTSIFFWPGLTAAKFK